MVHFRLAELRTEVAALRALTYQCCELYISGKDVSKLASSDLHLVQTVQTGYHPIGITYDKNGNEKTMTVLGVGSVTGEPSAGTEASGPRTTGRTGPS